MNMKKIRSNWELLEYALRQKLHHCQHCGGRRVVVVSARGPRMPYAVCLRCVTQYTRTGFMKLCQNVAPQSKRN